MSGWTQTPNFIYDLMPEMKEAEIKVVMAVARQTIGWQRERVPLRMTDFEKLTGLTRPTVNTGIKAAMQRGILTREADGETFSYWLEEPEPSEETVKNFNHEAVNGGQEESAESKNSLLSTVKNFNHEDDEESKNFLPSAVKNLNSETVKNFNPNKRNINTNKPKKVRERSRPQHTSPSVSRMPPKRISSPHLDPRHFVNGFIPAGTGASAVEVYYERFSIREAEHRLSQPLEDDLIANCKDLGLLREVIAAYHQAGYKKQRNIKLILDWYQDPSRFRKDHHGTHNGYHSPTYEPPPSANFTQEQLDNYIDPDRDEIPY